MTEVMIRQEIEQGVAIPQAETAPAMKKICAWCLVELGVPVENTFGVTHGICATCKDGVMDQLLGFQPTRGDVPATSP